MAEVILSGKVATMDEETIRQAAENYKDAWFEFGVGDTQWRLWDDTPTDEEMFNTPWDN